MTSPPEHRRRQPSTRRAQTRAPTAPPHPVRLPGVRPPPRHQAAVGQTAPASEFGAHSWHRSSRVGLIAITSSDERSRRSAPRVIHPAPLRPLPPRSTGFGSTTPSHARTLRSSTTRAGRGHRSTSAPLRYAGRPSVQGHGQGANQATSPTTSEPSDDHRVGGIEQGTEPAEMKPPTTDRQTHRGQPGHRSGLGEPRCGASRGARRAHQTGGSPGRTVSAC